MGAVSHEDKIPEGAHLSLQGVCLPLGGCLILILDKAKPSVRRGRKAPGLFSKMALNIIVLHKFFRRIINGGKKNGQEMQALNFLCVLIININLLFF